MDELERLKKHIGQMMNAQNNQGLPEFEGYSPNELQAILYNIFDDECPVQLSKLDEADYKKIPILNQVKYLLQLVENQGELKLTAKGYLPTKIVADIYAQQFIKDEFVESGMQKLYKETDANSINLTRILAELTGVVKKRNNKLSLTQKGKKELNDNHSLLKNIFVTFGNKFNWAYYDGCGENQLGQLGFGFSLLLLSKYGAKKRLNTFYANKYIAAFPRLLSEIEPSQFQSIEQMAANCYSLRTFERFLDYFGIIKIYSGEKWDSDKSIVKTELFEKLIKVQPHRVG